MNKQFGYLSENLDRVGRFGRAVVGAALIAAVMAHPGTYVGWLSVLALVAVYPMFEAITGFSPVRAAFAWLADQLHRPVGRQPLAH